MIEYYCVLSSQSFMSFAHLFTTFSSPFCYQFVIQRQHNGNQKVIKLYPNGNQKVIKLYPNGNQKVIKLYPNGNTTAIKWLSNCIPTATKRWAIGLCISIQFISIPIQLRVSCHLLTFLPPFSHLFVIKLYPNGNQNTTKI